MTIRVTPQMIEDNIESVHYFTAAEGVAGRVAHANWPDGTGDSVEYRDVAAAREASDTARGMYYSAPTSMHLLTFCVLVLKNGGTVVGKSACVDPAGFDKLIGRDVALENAKEQMWQLLGFRLLDKRAETQGIVPVSYPAGARNAAPEPVPFGEIPPKKGGTETK